MLQLLPGNTPAIMTWCKFRRTISTECSCQKILTFIRIITSALFSQRYHLLSHLTAEQNVEVPAVYAGLERKQRLLRAQELLQRLGLESRTEYYPAQLSGGQQQRVSIARALMNGGQVILADEPAHWTAILAKR